MNTTYKAAGELATPPVVSVIKTLALDIETYSGCDLTKCGVYKYSEAIDFEILLLGYSLNGGEVRVVDIISGEAIPPEIREALTDDNVIKYAHNTNFERICLSRYLGLPAGAYLSSSSWRCTMVWSAYMGLPLSLEGVGAVLSLDKQKLTEGKELIRYFCQPCKSTKANGGRTRNLPVHAPDKWEKFMEYNKRDVEAEMAIVDKLAKFPVPENIWEEYILDQEINDRGIQLDMTLVRSAIEMDTRSRSDLIRLMKQLTELDNPNSVMQMKEWLSDNGLETDTLGKKAVAELLKDAPEPLSKVLELRQQLARSSVKKYTAMENAVCSDGRARGMFQFYGASRTGRWSGRLIQMQNLPQNHMLDLEQARELVRSGNYDALELLYDDIPDTLSQLIRTAFIPKSGCKLVVSDFSSIERIVLAWLAGEKWVMDSYAAKRDLYIATASHMFNVPIENIDKKSSLRQKGKVADLACIAEGELVLTNKGLIAIENVTIKHRIWDGENWVSHVGVIYKGKKDCVNVGGVICTPDHKILIEEGWIKSGSSSGFNWAKVRMPNGFVQSREQQAWKSKMDVYMRLRSRKRIHFGKFNKRDIKIMWLFRDYAKNETRICKNTTDKNRAKVLPSMGGYEVSLQKSQTPKLETLRRSRNKGVEKMGKLHQLSDRYVIWLYGRSYNRPNRQQRRLRTVKLPLGYSQRKQSKYEYSKKIPNACGQFMRFGDSGAVRMQKRDSCGTDSERKNREISIETCYPSERRTYDILNCGNYRRFAIWNGSHLCLVHNCGYGGSVGALKAMGALDMGLSEDELQPLVTTWRHANPNIVRFWWDVDKTVKKAIKDRTTEQTHGIGFSYQSGFLFITLPSGRRLAYVKPRIEPNRFGGESVTYEGVGGTKKWERIESYGPKFVENIVQAISRDILCCAIQKLDYKIVMHCHDEIIIEADKNLSVEVICDLMNQRPDWAQDLLLRAEGFECQYYRK